MNSTGKIYSIRCWLNEKLQPATVCFENGIITEIHFEKLHDAEDAGNDIVMPGIIDAHVHVNEPGRTEWEGFDTITQAAAAGGITTIIDMPLNASPVTTTVKAFNEKITAAKNKLHVNCGFYGGLIPGNTQELEGLIHSGVMGIKCFLTHSGIDEFPNVAEQDLELAMPIMAKHNMPLLAHCELDAPCENSLPENPGSYKEYLRSRPKEWEDNAVALMIRLCRKHKCRVHIVHVSSANALQLIAVAKKEGLSITAETCAHYIYFNAEDIPDKTCIYKCAPPIREKENNQQLKEALKTGLLDFITTDHSPAPPEIKEIESGNLKKAWGGIAGVQFLLPASWTALKDKFSLQQFIPLLTSRPANFLGLKTKGEIKIGFDADLIIWNPDEQKMVTKEEILFRHKISPYIGNAFYGSIKQTIVNGITVIQHSTITNKNAGKWLARQ